MPVVIWDIRIRAMKNQRGAKLCTADAMDANPTAAQDSQ
jgi:hypothetical protein